MKIDLHCHTNLSDGSTGIDELIELARVRGVDVVAVTDHDTLAGSVQAESLGKQNGVTVVPGVEISSFDYSRGRRVHILCYYPQKSERLNKMLHKITANRRAAMSASLQKVLRVYPLPVEMVLARAQGSTSLYKQHVMQALMDAGYTNEIFGPLFRKLFDSKAGLAYIPIEYPDVLDVLETVHGAGGTAVLAHPSEYHSMELLQELSEKGLIQGAEAFHPRNRPEDVKAIQQCCEQYHMAVTGGTDFHGYYTRVCNPIGTYLTSKEQFDKLRKENPK